MTEYASVWPAERKALARPATVHIDHTGYKERLRYWLAMLFLALVVVAGWETINPPVARATADTPYQDVQTDYGACVYAKLHPGEITNGVELLKRC